MVAFRRRLGLLVALSAAALPLVGGRAGDAKNAHFIGNVVPIADVAGKVNAGDAQHALVGDDGKIYPLLKDKGARPFTKDKRLLNRPMRLTGRLQDGALQVINIHSLKNGKLHEVYYWCDICTIKGYENTICDCCGDPMVFREEPVK